MKEWNFS
jgi:hypothetical protein